MKEPPAIFIVRRALGKSPVACRIGIAAPIVSAAYFWGTNLKSKRRELWPKTSIHNPAHDEVEPPIFPTSRRLYSTPAIAAFGRGLIASSSFGCDIAAPAARRHSAPLSSGKRSRWQFVSLLPHENEK